MNSQVVRQQYADCLYDELNKLSKSYTKKEKKEFCDKFLESCKEQITQSNDSVKRMIDAGY